jgi:hypothetical protein
VHSTPRHLPATFATGSLVTCQLRLKEKGSIRTSRRRRHLPRRPLLQRSLGRLLRRPGRKRSTSRRKRESLFCQRHQDVHTSECAAHLLCDVPCAHSVSCRTHVPGTHSSVMRSVPSRRRSLVPRAYERCVYQDVHSVPCILLSVPRTCSVMCLALTLCRAAHMCQAPVVQ